MAKFVIFNSYSQVLDATESEFELIKQACLQSRNVWYFNKLTKKKSVKKREWTYLTKNGWVPTGWLHPIHHLLKEAGFSPRYEDRRSKHRAYEGALEGVFEHDLRPYQEEAVSVMEMKERGVIKLPTGSGKTYVGANIIDRLGESALFVVPDLNLLSQTYETFREIWDPSDIGWVGEGRFEARHITVATAATLWSRRETKEVEWLLDATKVLILDEAHGTGYGNGAVWAGREDKDGKKVHNPTTGNTYFQIAMKCRNAYYRYGLTATPPKGEQGNLLTCVTGKIIIDIPYTSLRDAGYLSSVLVSVYDVDMNMHKKEWRDNYRIWMRSPKVNSGIAKLAKDRAKQGKSVLIVVDEIEDHGNVLKDFLPEAVILYGSDKERVKKIKELGSKKKTIMISTTIKKGVDIPSLDVGIRASAKQSYINVIQFAGRATRVSEGKHCGEIIDFHVKGGNHLEKWSEKRLITYEEEGFEIIHQGPLP